MDYFKSLMLLIVLFSFTAGGPKISKAHRHCEIGMQAIFDLDTPLLKCIEKAIREFREFILPFKNKDKKVAFTDDVNSYYWKMFRLVSADKIELKETFCGRIGDFAGRFTQVGNPNSADCEKNLESFESVKRGIVILGNIKKYILYNALYEYEMISSGDENGIRMYQDYKDAYLGHIINKVELINGNDLTPRKFCDLQHKYDFIKDADRVDEGPSNSS